MFVFVCEAGGWFLVCWSYLGSDDLVKGEARDDLVRGQARVLPLEALGLVGAVRRKTGMAGDC